MAFSLGLIVSAGGLFALELWCKSQLKKLNSSREHAKEFISVDELKKLYPSGVYPSLPAEVPEARRYSGGYFHGTLTKHEHVLLNDPRFHQDSHRYIMRDGNGKILSDVNFFYDQFKRRITPRDAEKKNADHLLALFGDSNIVGYGLKEDETISHYLSLNLPRTKVYNYGVPAIYPYEILQRTESLKSDELPEKNGVALYFFFSYHMLRNTGAIRELAQPYSHKKRVVEVGPQGEVVLKGTFQEERPFWCWIAPYLWNSAIFRYFRLDFKPQEKDFRVQIAIVKAMKKNLEAKGLKFFVIIHPHQHALDDTQTFVSYLDKEKIPFIYFGHWKMDKYIEGPATLVYDMHVSKYVNERFADGLSRVLRNDLSMVK